MNRTRAIEIAKIALNEAENTRQAHLVGCIKKKIIILPMDVVRELVK